MIHPNPHILAGKTVTLVGGSFDGQPFRIEDWWDRVSGKSWMDCDGNPACMDYALRSGTTDFAPIDNDVVYGKLNRLGKLIHGKFLKQAPLAEISEQMIAAGAHTLSEWLNDEAPIGEQRFRDPAKSCFEAMHKIAEEASS